MQKFYPPRDGDLDRDQLEKAAAYALQTHPPGTEVHFKFTCKHCGTRCTFNDPNKLYEFGDCAACGKSTVVLFGGFSLVFTHYVTRP